MSRCRLTTRLRRGGPDGEACPGADLAVVFGEANVTDPVQAVFGGLEV